MLSGRRETGSIAGRRRGFALFAAIILITVIAVMATVVTVTLSGDNDQDRIEQAADVLHRLASALDTANNSNLGASFVGNVLKYPTLLSSLYTPITTSDFQCFAGPTAPKVYTTTMRDAWRGPYYLVPIPKTGYRIAPGFTANNQLHQGPVGATTVDTLAIEIPSVSLQDARLLELFVDRNGISNGLGNFVKYSPRDGTSPVTVEYVIFTPSRQGKTTGCS